MLSLHQTYYVHTVGTEQFYLPPQCGLFYLKPCYRESPVIRESFHTLGLAAIRTVVLVISRITGGSIPTMFLQTLIT